MRGYFRGATRVMRQSNPAPSGHRRPQSPRSAPARVCAAGWGRFAKRPHYLPVQQACRLPKKAEIPSCASAASEFMLMISLA